MQLYLCLLIVCTQLFVSGIILPFFLLCLHENKFIMFMTIKYLMEK